ncbi:DUF7288 family protein [Halobellus clavatus]|uniref:Uncharacterized protein n=1 Tax=Halobellus clavatus TaxID=660517 RepID=A0A1H3D4Z0_9EURY|nr:hypothetical protein [Halobellus clavatus]SDX61188.1 hypothetical protein SAMN04487946_101354 [Halobellus clavatus]
MDRGQAHTLEAITAAMILVSSLVFALQVTAVTPLTGSTSSQHIENQQAAVAEGLLATAEENGTLTPTLLHWNDSAGTWHNATQDGYVQGAPPTAFGATLADALSDRGVAFDLTMHYVDAAGNRRSRAIVDLGEPSDHATSATRLVTLEDDDRLRTQGGSVSGTTLKNASYVVDDTVAEQNLYAVVEVELVVWRI